MLGATFYHQILLARVVDADDAVADAAGAELHCQMAQAAASARYNDPIARLCVCFSERRVDCYAGAEEGRGGGGVEATGDGRYVVCGGEDVLLECAGGVVAADFLGRGLVAVLVDITSSSSSNLVGDREGRNVRR
jgi:hypothetical protein